MSFIVNFLISAVIIGWAVWQLVKVIQKSKKVNVQLAITNAKLKN